MITKCCRDCNVTKCVSEFGNITRRKDGKSSRCLECDRLKQRASYKPEKVRPKLVVENGFGVCDKCLKNKASTDFGVVKSGGQHTSCKECKYEKERKFKLRPDHADRVRQYSLTPKMLWVRYRSGAQQKGHIYDLPLDYFIEHFWSKPCHYCGDLVPTAGVDRVDNTIGYIPSNCVSCCSTCNFMKLNYSVEEFLDQVLKIVRTHDLHQ
jgi:hypothetical protein